MWGCGEAEGQRPAHHSQSRAKEGTGPGSAICSVNSATVAAATTAVGQMQHRLPVK